MKSFLLFGDQTVETLTSIRLLLDKSRTSPSLRRFLADAKDVIQHHVEQLNLSERKRFYGFQSLDYLAEKHSAAERPDDLVATSLMTVAQLGELILHAELDSGIFNSQDVVIVGLCTGVLPAAACAASKGIDELLRLSIKTLSLAFHLAAASGRRSQQIENVSGHWGFSVINVAAQAQQQIIDRFHKDKGIPLHRHAYLSVVSDGWATVSAPPSTLEALFSYSTVLGNAPRLKLPFGAAVHAPHLPAVDIDSLLDASGIGEDTIISHSRIFSTSTCKPYVASTLRELFRAAFEDVVNQPLLLSDTINAVASTMRRGENVRLIPIGPLGHTSMAQRSLQGSGLKVELFDLPQSNPEDSFPAEHQPRDGSGHIAIVGMSGRFPGSESILEFWQSLLDQKEFSSKIPSSRFDLNAFFDQDGKKKNSTAVPFGNFLENPGHFDARMFKVSPREALQMDPLQRILLMCTYEALEMAGYGPNGTLSTCTDRVGTFFGQAADDYQNTNANEGADVYFVPAIQRSFAPGRLNYHFGWGGPSYSIDSACASSTSAVLLAFNSLLSRQCDTAVAGGGSLLTSPAVYSGLSQGGFLSKTGSCKSFQDSADGYCRGEGMGVVIMKRLEDAIADNDNITAVIRGAVRNYSSDATSITHPSTHAQQSLYQDLLQQSGVDASEVGYVEMHATATQAGDFAEMTSVSSVFGPARARDYPLYVGGVKANVGHGEAAAGIESLIKSIVMLKEKVIPGQPKTPEPFKLNSRYPPIHKMNIRVAENQQPFKAPSEKGRSGNGRRKILLNNFDAAGGNASLMLEEAPQGSTTQRLPVANQDLSRCHVISVSGHGFKSFIENKRNLLNYIRSTNDFTISDLAYTTTARRIHQPYRATYITETKETLLDLLTEDINRENKLPSPVSQNSGDQPTVAFAFTGQGRRYLTIGTQLYQSSQTFRESVDSYQRLCSSYGFESFIHLISGKGILKNSQATTTQSQLATIATELALLHLWKDWGVQPSIVIGHSLGEYAALCAAGVLSVHDTLYLVGMRASLLQESTEPSTHAMLSVGFSKQDTVKYLRNYGSCELACINAPASTVVSGSIEDIDRLESHLRGNKVSVTRLETPYAFHSRQMDSMVFKFALYAQKVQYEKPIIPIASTLKGEVVTEQGTFNADYLVQQARQPVNFVAALNAVKSSGVIDNTGFWIECGPHPTCLGMIGTNLSVPRDRLLSSLQSGQDDWKVISTTLAALHRSSDLIHWSQFHRDNAAVLKLLDLPAYAFELKDYWMPFKDYSNSQKSPVQSGSNNRQHDPLRYLLTSSLQSVQSETVSAKETSVTFESLVSEPKLFAAMQGHIVDGHSICPTSVFTDMALTAARYLSHKISPDSPTQTFSMSGMEITHPLVCTGATDDNRIFVTATQSAKSRVTAVSFSSSMSSRAQSHGSCFVQGGDADNWMQDWSKASFLVNLARQNLIASVAARKGHYLSKPIAYKLFSQLVEYETSYQAMEEVFVSNDFTQALANISLDAVPKSNDFVFSPYWLDALVHLSGFMMNCNFAKSDTTLYISTGFESMRLARQPEQGRNYASFVHVNNVDHQKGNVICDCYVFDSEEIIGVVSGIVFHKMERSVFGAVVAAASGSANVQRVIAKPETTSSSKKQISKVAASASVPTASSQKNEIEIILAAVAKQTGVDPSELEDETLFADLGVDSLMSITITDVLQKEAGISLPAAFFQANASVEAVRKALDDDSGDQSESDSEDTSSVFSTDTRVSDASTTDNSRNNSDLDLPLKPETKGVKSKAEVSIVEPTKATPAADVKPLDTVPTVTAVISEKTYSSKAVLLQGRKISNKTPLFLITDGAGSATAYIHLPTQGRPVYALESPFLQDPEAFDWPIEKVCDSYLATVRKVQPKGPYLLGGWSAGAVYSYEVSRMLLNEGETVLGLIMLDMRVPKPLPYHPNLTMDLLEASGITAGVNRAGGMLMAPMSLRLKQHLLSVCRALTKYVPQAMDPQRRPKKTYMIWAKLGLSEVVEDALPARSDDSEADKTETGDVTKRWFYGDAGGNGEKKSIMEDAETGLTSWFYAKRSSSSFGSNGWDKLVGEELKTWVVDADHFSMVAMPAAAVTGKYIKEALQECAQLD